MDTLLQDLRHSLRQLRRSPGFAAVAVLSLGLGIGANTAIFGLIDAVMLKSLPPGSSSGRGIPSEPGSASAIPYGPRK